MRFALVLAVLIGMFAGFGTGCAVGPPPTISVSTTTPKKLADLIGGVEFILYPDRTEDNIEARNVNDTRVWIRVKRTDKALDVLNVDFLASRDIARGTLVFETGARYFVDVKIWEDGFTRFSCVWDDTRCFQARDTTEFEITQ